jgi:RNA polymerase sigma-70 factor (ECF subfamily)
MNVLPSPAPSSRQEDNDLARRIAAGDAAAFERLMRQYNQRLYRLARVTLRNDGDAEDALQEAYWQAYRAMGEFRGESSLGTWLSQLVRNECLNRLRKQARRDGLAQIVPVEAAEDGELPDTETDTMHAQLAERPEDTLARTQLRDLIERKLDELPDSFASVFVLRGIEELSVEETALSLGIPEATVRSRYFRARGLLRAALAQDLDLAQKNAFAFDGARCDRIVAAVLQRQRRHTPGDATPPTP